MKVPIKKGTLEKLVIVARGLGEDEEKHGSVSIELDSYFGEKTTTAVGVQHVQWITLFDHPDDDHYDGILGEDDEEIPRVQVEFVIEDLSQEPKPSKAPTTTQKQPKTLQ